MLEGVVLPADPVIHVTKSGVLLTRLLCDPLAHPAAEEVSPVPTELVDQPLGITNHTPGVIQKPLEVQIPEYLADVLYGVAEPHQCSRDSPGRGIPDPLHPGQDDGVPLTVEGGGSGESPC